MATEVILEEEQEGEHVETTDYFFEKIGEPVPVGNQADSPFDLQSPPLQPLAVAEQFQLLFVAHSSGFYVARTKEVMDLAKEIKEKGSGASSSSIQELCLVDVPIGRPRILAVSVDSSTLVVSNASDVHFFLVKSLLNKEVKPSFSCSVTGASFVKGILWRKNGDGSFLILSDTGVLAHGVVNYPPKHVMDGVDAVEWSVKGSFVAVAKGQSLRILSSKFVEKTCFLLQFKSWISDADGSRIVKVDSIMWIRLDCIILGCYLLSADGQEENYFVHVLRSKGSKITDATSEKVQLSFSDVFPGLMDDILPFGNGPYLFLSYLEQGELAITANRKNTDQHILLLSWSLGEDEGEPKVVDIERDNWLPRIELQDNGDDNLIMGLCIDKVSINGKVTVQLGVEQQKELPPYCVLMCLTLEGKLVMFHVASTMENKPPPNVSTDSDGEEDFPLVECQNSGVLCQQRATGTNVFPEFDNQKGFKNSIQSVSQTFMAGGADFVMKNLNKKGTQGPAGLEAIGSSHVDDSQTEVATAGPNHFNLQKNVELNKESASKTGSWNLHNVSMPNASSSSWSSPRLTFMPDAKSSFSSSGLFSEHVDNSQTEVAAAGPNHFNLQKNVELNKESAFKTGSWNLHNVSMPNASSSSWSSPRLTFMPDAKSSFSSSGLFSEPSLAEYKRGTSAITSVPVKPANVVGQRAPVDVGEIEPLPSIRSLEFSSNSAQEKVHFFKDDWRPVSQSVLSKSEPNLSKQFSNIKDMVTELDTLLISIEGAGGFVDACITSQKSSVESLERGLASLGEKCEVSKNMLDERAEDAKQLLDKYRQVLVKKTYVEGIFRQASNQDYKKLWNRQKLSPELELKQKRILQLNQDLTRKMFELERHFSSLECNKFGDGVATNAGRRGLQKKYGPSRNVESIHTLHNTMASQIASAEHLSDCLSKQMEALCIKSPLKKPSVKEELFRTIGISYDPSFSSPDMKKISEVAAGNRLALSPHTAATKDQSRRLSSSAFKSHDPDTARRRRDSLDRSVANFEPPKTTVRRMLSQESHKPSTSKSSSRVGRQPLMETLERPAIAWMEDQKSHLLLNKSPNKGDLVPGKDFVNQSAAFRWGSSPPKSSTLGSNSSVEKNHSSDSEGGSYSMVSGSYSGISYLPKPSLASPKQVQTQSNMQVKHSCLLDQSHFQVSSSPQKSLDVQKSFSKVTMPSDLTPGGVKLTSNTATTLLFESRFSQPAAVSAPVSSAAEVPKLDTVISKSQPGGREASSSSFSVPSSALSSFISSLPSTSPFMPFGENNLFSKSHPSVSAPSSLTVGIVSSSPAVSPESHQTGKTSSPQLSKLANVSTTSVSTDEVISSSNLSSASTTSVSSSVPTFSLADSRSQVQLPTTSSSTYSTTKTLKEEVQAPLDMLTVKRGMESKAEALPLQSKSPHTEAGLEFESVQSSSPAIDITSKAPPVVQPIINSSSAEPSVELDKQPVQSPGGGVNFSVPLSTPASLPDSKVDSQDVSGTQEDEMEEEAPETNQKIEVSFGNLDGFGLGSTPNSAAPKPNLFGTIPFGNAATAPASSSFSLSAPAGELFKPASFSFQSPQTTQVTQQSQPSFGQPANVGPGQQVLETVLGSFGQSRQLGSGLPGSGGSPNTFAGGLASTQSAVGSGGAATGGGFANVGATSGGFAALASGSGGFGGLASGGAGFGGLSPGTGGFGGLTSPSVGFGASASPTGGFPAAAAPTVGSFAGVASGGGFGSFGGQQGIGGFGAFGNNAAGGGASKPPDFLTQMRR